VSKDCDYKKQAYIIPPMDNTEASGKGGKEGAI